MAGRNNHDVDLQFLTCVGTTHPRRRTGRGPGCQTVSSRGMHATPGMGCRPARWFARTRRETRLGGRGVADRHRGLPLVVPVVAGQRISARRPHHRYNTRPVPLPMAGISVWQSLAERAPGGRRCPGSRGVVTSGLAWSLRVFCGCALSPDAGLTGPCWAVVDSVPRAELNPVDRRRCERRFDSWPTTRPRIVTKLSQRHGFGDFIPDG